MTVMYYKTYKTFTGISANNSVNEDRKCERAQCENSLRAHSTFLPDDISAVKLALLQKSKLDLTL